MPSPEKPNERKDQIEEARLLLESEDYLVLDRASVTRLLGEHFARGYYEGCKPEEMHFVQKDGTCWSTCPHPEHAPKP